MWRKCEAETKQKLDLPWKQEQTLIFLDWLISDRKVSAATASSYLAGMKKAHEMRGLDDHVLRKGLVNQVIKGKQHLEAVEKRTLKDKGRLPVTLTIMEMIKETIRTSTYPVERKLLIWTVCTLAFHGSFRIHEILCQNETFFDPAYTLLARDVVKRQHKWPDGKTCDALQVTVKCPKESKKGAAAIVDVFETAGPTCPVKAFRRWSNLAHRAGDQVLFSTEEHIPLTGKRLNDILRRLLCEHIDFSKGQITAHSFRSGVPSLLASLGHCEEDIKRVGRWSSRAFEHYVKLPRTSRAAIAQKLGRL